MCEPVTIALVAIALASSVTSGVTSSQASKATKRSAEEAAAFEQRQARARAVEESRAAADAKLERSRQTAAEVGRVQNADLPERSIASLGRLVAVEAGLADVRARTNLEFSLNQARAAEDSAGITLRSRTAGLPSTGSIVAGSVLDFASSALTIGAASSLGGGSSSVASGGTTQLPASNINFENLA